MLKQLAQKLMGGLAVGAFAAVALFARVGDQPRLWDVLMDHFGSSQTVFRGPNVIWADGERPVNRMMVTGDSSFAPATAVGQVPGVAQAPVSRAAAPTAAPAADWKRHLSGALALFDITGPASEHSSASVSAAAAPAPAASAPSYSAPTPSASVASLGTAAQASPTYVSYGNTSRADIMSSASGPVYYFGGGLKRR